MTAKPKLLYLVTEDWYFCSHRLPLAVAAIAAGFEVTVVTRVRDHGEIIRQAGIRLIPFEMLRRGINPLRELTSLVKLIAIYRREKPDLLHHVAIKPVLYGSFAVQFYRHSRVVNAVAGLGWLFSSTSFTATQLRKLVLLAFRLLLPSSTIIVQNPEDAEVMKQTGLSDIRLIRGAGVDTDEFSVQSEPDAPVLVLFPARLLWDKGVGEFVEAARLLKARAEQLRFVLVGSTDEGSLAAVPVKQLAAWSKEGVIEYWGQRNDMPKVFAQAHIVCLPSFYGEGIPKALIEAASCGRPVVTTDSPGCREIVRNDDNGLLIPMRDVPALAKALLKLIKAPDLRRRMGERGRQRAVNEFSQTQVIEETLEVYRGLLKA